MTDYTRVISIALITLAFSAGAATKKEKNWIDVSGANEDRCQDLIFKSAQGKAEFYRLKQLLKNFGEYTDGEATLVIVPKMKHREYNCYKTKTLESLNEQQRIGAMRFWDEIK